VKINKKAGKAGESHLGKPEDLAQSLSFKKERKEDGRL